jgi:hypothetical protein
VFRSPVLTFSLTEPRPQGAVDTSIVIIRTAYPKFSRVHKYRASSAPSSRGSIRMLQMNAVDAAFVINRTAS